MRLIDADTLRKDVEKDRDASDMPKMWYQGVEYAINHIIHAPTVDAVEVVRCKDCKWYEESIYQELRPMRFCYRLKNDDGVPVGYNWADNDFCSYGERREER